MTDGDGGAMCGWSAAGIVWPRGVAKDARDETFPESVHIQLHYGPLEANLLYIAERVFVILSRCFTQCDLNVC